MKQSSSTTLHSKVSRPPTKALYSIHDQLDDLRVKEIDLERAKAELYQKAEEHRFQVDLDRARKEFDR